jgi:selenoprotein W-related protein
LAEVLEREFKIKPTMIEGRGGVFDVKVNDELIYSKHETGQFPEHDLIVRGVRERITTPSK